MMWPGASYPVRLSRVCHRGFVAIAPVITELTGMNPWTSALRRPLITGVGFLMAGQSDRLSYDTGASADAQGNIHG